MRADQGQGTVLESLSFEGGGDSSNNQQATVLSCGGIHVPQQKIPTEMKKWRQIINIPGAEMTAKIFGFSSDEPGPISELEQILRKEVLN